MAEWQPAEDEWPAEVVALDPAKADAALTMLGYRRTGEWARDQYGRMRENCRP